MFDRTRSVSIGQAKSTLILSVTSSRSSGKTRRWIGCPSLFARFGTFQGIEDCVRQGRNCVGGELAAFSADTIRNAALSIFGVDQFLILRVLSDVHHTSVYTMRSRLLSKSRL